MPICDGYESTRMIRRHEQERTNALPSTQPPSPTPTPTSSPTTISPERAFILAVTGLASERDQNEAFAAGMDYFATKPLSLLHLRTLMEEWESDGSMTGNGMGLRKNSVVKA